MGPECCRCLWIGAPLRLRWQEDQVRHGAEDAQPPPRLRGASLLWRVWVMVQGAPRGLSASVLNAVLKSGQIRGSEASSPSVPRTAPRAWLRSGLTLRRDPLLRSLARSLLRGNLLSFTPGGLARGSWVGLALWEEGGRRVWMRGCATLRDRRPPHPRLRRGSSWGGRGLPTLRLPLHPGASPLASQPD